jgi:hypothetical protein
MSVQISLEALLLLSNGPELALHRHDRELKKTCINFIPCSARTISSFCQTIIFFGAISIHCAMNQYISIMFERCQFKSLWKLMIFVHIRFVNY